MEGDECPAYNHKQQSLKLATMLMESRWLNLITTLNTSKMLKWLGNVQLVSALGLGFCGAQYISNSLHRTPSKRFSKV